MGNHKFSHVHLINKYIKTIIKQCIDIKEKTQGIEIERERERERKRKRAIKTRTIISRNCSNLAYGFLYRYHVSEKTRMDVEVEALYIS